eukprot:CAMPEP_0174932132 /NCGR_PEP_ID=MMETSP1355-20121228/35537_1 /TAXON_ID=464990 /ORGANISM="Hemiselmis tepida, Strain CCMP443" /LENGTH=224 /DNA_ID=CAMNT_0016178531 /DNA_START=15 /DNA_END=689 /DNA_ORIENTATION=-
MRSLLLLLLVAPAAVVGFASAPMRLSTSRMPARAVRAPMLAASRMAVAVTDLPIGLDNEDYTAWGLAQCFTMVEGQLQPIMVVEPLTGATLECIDQGVGQGTVTSYKRVMALKVGDAVLGGVEDPTGINMEALAPLIAGEDAQICDNALDRAFAAGRTLKRRPEAQVVKLGETCEDYKFDPNEEKRILNLVNVVDDDDNVKQDISIDVYGRGEKEEVNPLGNMV